MALGIDGAASHAAGDTGQTGDGPASGVPQAPEELIEIQLRSILEATQTSAGAVCLFDQHQELLRLAVEVGLSDEGCRRLRSVRRGAATTWDMPLHSLLNRRVYLIESAAKNRYVPPLVDDVGMVRAVACIPLYDGSTPVGSLILVALAPRSFGERQIRLLEQPVRELVANIGAMRKRVTAATPVRAARPSLQATAVPKPAGEQVAGPSAPGLRTAPAAPGNAGSIQAAVDRARTEIERLRARLAETEAAQAAEGKRATELEQRLADVQGRIQELQTERDRGNEALAARTNELAIATDRVERLERALDEARSGEAALRAELDHARATTESERAAAAESLTARLHELESLNERLTARLAESEAREAALRTELDARAAEAQADAASATAALEARVASVTAECEALRGQLADTEATAREARAAAATADATAADLVARATAAEESAASWQRRCEAAKAERPAAANADASPHDPLEAFADERARWDEERTAAAAREEALAERVRALEAELDHRHDQDVTLRDGFERLEALIQTEIRTTDAGEADGLDAASIEVVELDADGALDDLEDGADEGGGLVVEEIVATPPASESATPAAEEPAVEGVLVIDVDRDWAALAPPDATVAAAPPAGVGSLGTRPARILVNLAAPNALAALADVRHAGVRAPSFGCVTLPGQDRGVFLGRLELAARPIDPDALVTALREVFARGTKVVTAGADVDGLISLRQALARLGVSVSMAWDAKQAGDLLAMVKPEVAIIDLELPPKDGTVLVARMGLQQPTPLTVVIPKMADTAAAFATAAAHPELVRSALPTSELLARVIAAPTKPAARR